MDVALVLVEGGADGGLKVAGFEEHAGAGGAVFY